MLLFSIMRVSASLVEEPAIESEADGGITVQMLATLVVTDSVLLPPRLHALATRERLIGAGWKKKGCVRGFYEVATPLRAPAPQVDRSLAFSRTRRVVKSVGRQPFHAP